MTTLPRSDLTDGAGSLSEAASPGTSELTRFTPAGSSPDAAAIARMANAFYAGTPSNPFPGPGAALPSAPVFSAEPIYNSLPGTPALQPPLSPNLNPGLPPMPIPASGAAQPSAPVFSIEPMLGQAQSSPLPSFIQPQGGKNASRRPARAAGADTVVPDASQRRAVGTRTARHSERFRPGDASLLAGRRDVAHPELRGRAVAVRTEWTERTEWSGHGFCDSGRNLLVSRSQRRAGLRSLAARRQWRDARRVSPTQRRARLEAYPLPMACRCSTSAG